MITTLADVAAMPRVLPSWLGANTDPVAAAVIVRALACVGECEEPASSNRGPMVDRWNTDRGAPLGSYWCASFATSMWHAGELETAGFGHDPICDQLLQWCVRTNRFSKVPSLGAFCFYGAPGQAAHHVGLVMRVAPYLVTVEGNAAWGGAFTTNGEAVISRRPDPASPNILGYGAIKARVTQAMAA